MVMATRDLVPQLRGILADSVTALRLTCQATAKSLVEAWLYVPFGILVMLVACFAADVILKHANAGFPASVSMLILLFIALLLSEGVLGSRRTKRIVALIDVPAGWSLRWINVCFLPTFVLLPLSPAIGPIETGKIIAVFVVGFVAMMVGTVYLTRALQLLRGSSKRARIQRAEELGDDPDNISPDVPPSQHNPRSPSAASLIVPLMNLPTPPRSQSSVSIRSYDTVQNSSFVLEEPLTWPSPLAPQAPLQPTRAQRWSTFVISNLDMLIFLTLFVTVGIPVYYGTGYSMPLHLTLCVLNYFAALTLPSAWRQYLHPVLVSSLFTVLGIWAFGATRGQELPASLKEYRTGLKYLQLWEGTQTAGMLPGAGDVLATILDASIVALALPMYTYRRELRNHFAAIIVPNVIVSVASLFAYPIICFAIGIAAERSLAFSARSITLALASPAVENLGGDVNTVATLAIMSGIVGVLVGGRILTWLKVPDDDYVTRGVTYGGNAGAIATAMLLRSDPRAAALSSLSMTLFGTVTVLFTSIPPITAIVRSMVNL